VRSLAQRSSQAAKDIKDLIMNSSNQVQDGVQLVNRAGTSLKEILDSIKQVADIVADIATASSEQAGGIEQVNKALTQMDEVTQQNSAMVEQNAATARTLEQNAAGMDERIGAFNLNGSAAIITPMVKRPAPAATVKKAVVAPRGARQMQSRLATAVAKDEWEEF
jgi:methyl-accepting chemotaxis protein